MKRKVLYGIMSALLIAVCAFALTACSSPQEKELRSIGDERATSVVAYGDEVNHVQQQTSYYIDGDKLRIMDCKALINMSPYRVTEFTEMFFWMDGETLRCVERYVVTHLEDVQQADVYRQSYNNLVADKSKLAASTKTDAEIKEMYDKAKALFDVSGTALGKEIDADKELYKDKGYSFATSNDAMNAGDLLARITEDGSKKTVKSYCVEDKKLVSKRDAVAKIFYSYSYDMVVVTIPSQFTQNN